MKTLNDYNFSGKRVLVRCDFNAPMKNNVVLDDFKIQRALPTINYLRARGAVMVLTSHLGNPDKKNRENYSLKPAAALLEKFLGAPVIFCPRITGREVKNKIKSLKPGQIIMLENLRFEKGEENQDEKFAKKLAEFGEYYVNEAFSACHRPHASVALLPKIIPGAAGLNLEKEIEVLSQVRDNAKKPLSIVIGGAKIQSKLAMMEKFLNYADHILIGSKIADYIMRVKSFSVGRDWPSKEIVEMIKKIDITNPKIHLPVDVLVSPDQGGDVYVRETGPGKIRKDEEMLDVGQETSRAFSEIISNSKTIFWSGPLGLFENPKFAKGTKDLAETIAKTKGAFSVAGGGETIAALAKFNLLDKFSFISTGGGAMLAFLAGEPMPGLEALK